MSRPRTAVAAFAGALAAWPGLAPACEACRNTLADDPEAAGFSRGVYVTILVMLAAVFSLAAVFIRAAMKEDRSLPAAKAPVVPEPPEP